jgi:serine/threonine-protein kinase HipA
MKRKLDVYLHHHLIGNLVQDEHGQMMFDYAEAWLKNPAALALSRSLPLTKKHFNRNDCRGFFAGILPEESKREIVAHNLGISAKNDFAMLEQIGGECAGAVTFIPAGQQLPKREDDYRALTDKQLAEILKALPRRPLMAGEAGIRLSLAGAQDKIAVHVSGNKISIPLGGAPSTHTLKPAIDRFEGLVFNEALCMKGGLFPSLRRRMPRIHCSAIRARRRLAGLD